MLQVALRDAPAESDEFKRPAQTDASDRSRLASQAEAMTSERNARERCADLQRHIDDMRTARAGEQAAHFHVEGTRAAGIAAAEIAGVNAELLGGPERLAAAKVEVAVLRNEVTGSKSSDQ